MGRSSAKLLPEAVQISRALLMPRDNTLTVPLEDIEWVHNVYASIYDRVPHINALFAWDPVLYTFYQDCHHMQEPWFTCIKKLFEGTLYWNFFHLVSAKINVLSCHWGVCFIILQFPNNNKKWFLLSFDSNKLSGKSLNMLETDRTGQRVTVKAKYKFQLML